MIPLSRAFIRAALAWLVIAFVLGAFTAWAEPTLAAALGPVARHALVLGWLTQLVLGVAWWMFPRKRGAPATVDSPSGWACFALLNSGLLLRAWSEPASILAPGRLADLGNAAASVLSLSAVLLFSVSAWRRVGAR